MCNRVVTADHRPCRMELVGGLAAPVRYRVCAPPGHRFSTGDSERLFESRALAIEVMADELLVAIGDD